LERRLLIPAQEGPDHKEDDARREDDQPQPGKLSAPLKA
jgi:hypothetical protein